MKRLIAAAAILAVVFVMGCQDTKKVTELQGQIDKLNQQITEMQTVVVAQLTAERDSLQKLVLDYQAKYPAKSTAKPPTSKSGGGSGTVKPPTKK